MQSLILSLLESYCLGDDKAAFPLWDIMSELDNTLDKAIFDRFLEIVLRSYQEKWIYLSTIVERINGNKDAMHQLLNRRLAIYSRNFGITHNILYPVNRYYIDTVGRASLLGCIAIHEIRRTYNKSLDTVFLIGSIVPGVNITDELSLVRHYYPSTRFQCIP